MVVTTRGGRGGSNGQGCGGTQGRGRGKQTVGSGSRVKPTVGRTGGVSGPSGPTAALTKRTKVAPGGVKQTGGDASTSCAPPPVSRREGKGRAGGLDTLEAVIEDATTTGGRPEIDIAGEVPARQSSHTPPQRVRSTGGGSSYSSNPTSRSPPMASRSHDSQATVSISRTRSIPHQFGDTTNRLPFAQLTSRATSGDHLSNLNLNDQPRHQSSQSRHIEEEVENEDEEDEEEEEEEEDADDFGDGEPDQAEEFNGYHEPKGLDDEQLLENVLALPGRQRLPLLSEVPIRDSLWFTRNNGILTRCIAGIFRRKFDGPYYSWGVTPIVKQELYFRTFARKYNWDIGITELVRANFNRIATKQMRGIDPGAGAEDPDLSSELSTHRNLTVDEKNQLFLKCTEFDQKGNPFGIGGLSQTFNKGKRKVQYATSSSVAVDLEELQEEMKSARQKIVEHDEEIRRRDEENKKRDEENQKWDEENRRRDAELLELRQRELDKGYFIMASENITLNEGWSYMLTGVAKIARILEGKLEASFEAAEYLNLYTTIYNMCIQTSHDYSQELYDGYRGVFEDYAKHTVLPSLKEKHDEYMLKDLALRWSNHKVMVGWLSRFFYYLDRYFVTRRSLPTLNEVGMICFRDLVYMEMKSKAKDAILALVHDEREGGQIDRALLKNVLDIFVKNGMGNMETYEEDFESFMLQDTASYYSRKASSWIQEDSCPEYMLKAEECIKKEKERVTHYLQSSTEDKLVEKVQDELLVVVAKQLQENEHSGCRALLRDDKMDDLSRMFWIYHKITRGLEPVADLFKKHITAEGNFLIKQAEEAATNQAGGMQEQEQVLVRKIIELHEKYMVYVTECFQSHSLFHKALKEAFENFCNKNVAGSSSAEVLASFCDNLFKKGGSEKLSDEAIEATLENVVKLLVYISDKDLFAEFYRKKQARRLLFDRSGNDDHERSILSKLKERFGGQFTSKMEGMVTDMVLARENQNNFTDYLSTNMTTKLGIDLTVTVLTTGFWPSYKTTDLNLPSEMVKCIEVFKAFYETRTKHRRLVWIYSLGTCQVIGNFDQKPIEMMVTTYQAAVLLLFNNTSRLSYNEMFEQLNLSHEDLARLLHSLSCAKYKILIKEPMSRNISKSDVFEFNSKFTDKMQRIKIPLPPMDERKKVVEVVDQDRRYAIEASLVRIMKSRKVLSHQQLVSECVEHLSRMFKPDVKMIKKRIEDLISRDYMKRDTENRNMFKYVA
ncbi:hypothetical protein AALP_AA7G174800 [Arabis alpina]|uniref:Cullin-1 n=1 Tax=Arabis alpina TaxID=50452 RepID=A0A087GIQ3_ARAAL|nr:hypothetical protein AALP_AA7G174800 [Arabis alpina]